MKTHARLASLSLVALVWTACRDSAELAADDAAISRPCGALDASCGPPDYHDVPLPRSEFDESAWVPPETPQSFSIALQTKGCLGTCPFWQASLDEHGRLEFHGEQYTDLLGVAHRQLEPALALTLFRELRSTRYWQLRNLDWSNENLRRCPHWATDGPSAFWTVTVDGQTRSVTVNEFCYAVEIREIFVRKAGFEQATGLWQWIGLPQPSGSAPLAYASPPLHARYRVEIEGRAVAVLTFSGDDWQLVDCSSNPLASGRLEGSGEQWKLREALQSQGSVDGDITDPGTIVIEHTGDAGLTARGTRGGEPVVLGLVQAPGCD